jgi:hypothetical protein
MAEKWPCHNTAEKWKESWLIFRRDHMVRQEERELEGNRLTVFITTQTYGN